MMNAAVIRAIESLLVAGFLSLSFLMLSLALNTVDLPLWLPVAVSDVTSTSVLTVAVFLGLMAYWVLALVWSRSWSFWALAVMGFLSQLPVVLSYSQLDWLFFFTGQRWFDPPVSSLETGFYFLLSLAVLVLLYRTILLGDQEKTVHRRGVDELEYRRIILHQYLFIVGLIGCSLALAAGLVFLGVALGGIGALLERSPWTVLTVGGLATLIISATLLYWMKDSEVG